MDPLIEIDFLLNITIIIISNSILSPLNKRYIRYMQVRRLRRRWIRDNIRITFREIGVNTRNSIDSDQDRNSGEPFECGILLPDSISHGYGYIYAIFLLTTDYKNENIIFFYFLELRIYRYIFLHGQIYTCIYSCSLGNPRAFLLFFLHWFPLNL